jgi:hypothetical protein
MKVIRIRTIGDLRKAIEHAPDDQEIDVFPGEDLQANNGAVLVVSEEIGTNFPFEVWRPGSVAAI